MIHNRLIEIFLGLIILIATAIFIFYGVITVKNASKSTYKLSALFNDVGGLKKGDEVIIKGVKIGNVEDVFLTNDKVEVAISINKGVLLPDDSIFSIEDEGFLSGRKVAIKIGTSAKLFDENAVVKNTKDYEYLEDKIGKILFK